MTKDPAIYRLILEDPDFQLFGFKTREILQLRILLNKLNLNTEQLVRLLAP